MLSSTGLLVTALDKAFNIGKYQLVVAGVLLTLTAIKQPDGIAASPPPPLVKLRQLAGGEAVLEAREAGARALAAGRGTVIALDHAGLSVADLDAAARSTSARSASSSSSPSSCPAASAA